ncbi:MAG: glycosyltransferase, partial [Patescibacteria group bacterium]
LILQYSITSPNILCFNLLKSINMKLSFILPIYNEEKNIPILYNELKNIIEKLNNKISSYEMIFIDDGSKDNSFVQLAQLKTQDSNIKIIKFSRNF